MMSSAAVVVERRAGGLAMICDNALHPSCKPEVKVEEVRSTLG